jgi:hypothetical protein
MDGQFNSVTVARNDDGTLQLFATAQTGGVWTRNQILGGDQEQAVRPVHPVPATDSWTDWTQLDGALTQAAAVTDADGEIHLVGVNSAGALLHRQQAARNATDPSVDGAWTSWDWVQAPAPFRSVAATINSAGQVNIFGTASHNQLFQAVKLGNGTVYTRWASIPSAVQHLAAVKEGGGAGPLMLIGAAVDGFMRRNTSHGGVSLTPNGWTPDPWPGWQLVLADGGTAGGFPTE